MAFNTIAPLKKKNTEFPPIPKRGRIKARIFQSLINAAGAAVGGNLAGGGLNGKKAKFRPIPKRGRIKERIFQSLINTLFSFVGGGLIGNFAGVDGGGGGG